MQLSDTNKKSIVLECGLIYVVVFDVCLMCFQGLLFLPCFLNNNSNASGCLVVLNPVSSKTLILLEYISPPNDLKQACR